MYFGRKCKISWSNDDLERFLMFLKVRESIRCQGAMADRVKDVDTLSERVEYEHELFML